MANANTPRQPYPAVSVVIPLYNAEKFIGDCLNSILAQTFTNFEVIVVDDCSTDSSCAIVESYAEKFGGRLILSHMEKNSGSGSLPRNKGMNLSRGEYIFFVDNDDMITPTALEELYTLAKDYDADVVCCEKNYLLEDDKPIRVFTDKNVRLVEKPTFESNDLLERAKKILQYKYNFPQWRKLVRRRLIFEHELFFPNTRHADDTVWTYGLVLLTEKFLRVPNTVYIRRLTKNSIMMTKRTSRQAVSFWLNPNFFGLKSLETFLGKTKLSSTYRYLILENFVLSNLDCIINDELSLNPIEVYDTIREEFGKNFHEQEILTAVLHTMMYSACIARQKTEEEHNRKFNELAAQVQQVINSLEHSATP